MGAVDALDEFESSLGEFQGMASLSAAQIQDFILRRKVQNLDEHIDFLAGHVIVVHHIGVGFQVK